MRAEAGQAQPVVADTTVEPVAQAQQSDFGHRPLGQPITAGLVPGELAGVDHQNLTAGPCGPGGGRRAGRSGAHDEHLS